MNKADIKVKLRSIIRDIILLDLKNSQQVPETISNYFLENCCFTNNQKPQPEDLNNFILRIHEYIEEKHSMIESSSKQESCDLDLDYQKFLQAETEYTEVSAELVKMLEESMEMKAKALECFADQCKAQETSFDVIEKKCEFLKRQLFLKLYSEENALSGHLILRDMLKRKLDMLQKQYNELVELNKQYDEVKDNGFYLELLQKYKKLKEIEKRSEIINEIL